MNTIGNGIGNRMQQIQQQSAPPPQQGDLSSQGQEGKESTQIIVQRELIRQANKLTGARYDFSLIEKRCLYLVIREVRRLYVESNTGERTIFNDMFLRFKPSDLMRLGDEVKDVYNALRKLRHRDIEIENDKIWLSTSWITAAQHNKEENMYEVTVSRFIMPYLVELSKEYTELDLMAAIAMKSGYSQRFYEFICQYRNRSSEFMFFDIDHLRQVLKLEGKYRTYHEFKVRVINPAQKEIKELYDKSQSDIYFTVYKEEKEGKKVARLWIQIHTKERDQMNEYKKSVDFYVSEVCGILYKYLGGKKKAFIENVKKSMLRYPEICEDILKKLERIVSTQEGTSIPRFIHFVMGDDFGITKDTMYKPKPPKETKKQTRNSRRE